MYILRETRSSKGFNALTHQLPVRCLPKKGTSINWQSNSASNIGHNNNNNKTTRKKGNPESALRAESRQFPLFDPWFLDVVANEPRGSGCSSS